MDFQRESRNVSAAVAPKSREGDREERKRERERESDERYLVAGRSHRVRGTSAVKIEWERQERVLSRARYAPANRRRGFSASFQRERAFLVFLILALVPLLYMYQPWLARDTRREFASSAIELVLHCLPKTHFRLHRPKSRE